MNVITTFVLLIVEVMVF